MNARRSGSDSGLKNLDTALRRHPTYAAVILRTRFAEDALADAVRRGVRQYVLVGAGLDSFAFRRPVFGRELQIFEVDHPATRNGSGPSGSELLESRCHRVGNSCSLI